MTASIIIFTLIGILAILAELVLPGGILGITGIGCLIAAVVMIFTEYGAVMGWIAAGSLVVFCFAVVVFWMKNFHRLPFTKGMVLRNKKAPDDAREERELLIGKTGQASTDLRPSGRAVIDGEKFDVIAESGYIGKDAAVEVVGLSGSSLIVREKAA